MRRISKCFMTCSHASQTRFTIARGGPCLSSATNLYAALSYTPSGHAARSFAYYCITYSDILLEAADDMDVLALEQQGG